MHPPLTAFAPPIELHSSQLPKPKPLSPPTTPSTKLQQQETVSLATHQSATQSPPFRFVQPETIAIPPSHPMKTRARVGTHQPNPTYSNTHSLIDIPIEPNQSNLPKST